MIRRLLFPLIFAVLLARAEQNDARRESIVVTGTYDPIPLEEADRAVRSLDVTALSLLSSSYSDFLRLDSSLDLRQRAPNAVQGDLSIRGSTFGQTLVLVDGLRMNDVQSGHHNLDIPLPLDSVERIEVLKGAGSTLYGSDAVGGVVNIITRRPEVIELRLRTALGSWGTNQESGALSFVRSSISERLTFSRDFSTGFIPNRDYRNLSLASTTFLRTSSVITLAHSDRPFGAEQFYGNFHSWERTRTWFAGVRQKLGGKTEAAFAFRRHTDVFVLQRYAPELFTNRHATESFQAAVRRSDPVAANTRVYYGVEGYRNSIASNNLGRHERARGAAYVGVDARALHRFSLNAGVRDEVYGSFNHELSPMVSGGFWLNGRIKVRASMSRAFRLPTYTDLYYHDPSNVGSPDLRPEKAWSYEGGIDWNHSGRFRAELTVFQRRERDGIDYVRATAVDVWRARNFQRLRFTGVEAGLTTRIANEHKIDVRYTGLHGAQTLLTGLESKYAFNYPIHSGLVSVHSVWGGQLMTRVRAGVLERFGRNPYGVVDLYAARATGNWRPFAQITNLTDTAFEEILGVAMPGRGFLAGIEVIVFPSR